MKSGTYPGGNKTMKYIKKIDFSQKNLKTYNLYAV